MIVASKTVTASRAASPDQHKCEGGSDGASQLKKFIKDSTTRNSREEVHQISGDDGNSRNAPRKRRKLIAWEAKRSLSISHSRPVTINLEILALLRRY